MANLKMIVGLGNPGPQYQFNRHNVGFQCIDLFAQKHGVELIKLQLQARTGEGWIQQGGQRQKILLVKPLTYMNASGQAVGQLLRYYHTELTDLIVVHDDLDLSAGVLRLRPNGSSGGQNGIKSLIQSLGSPEFARIRVGVGRPAEHLDAAAHVLQNFSATEEGIFRDVRERVATALACWIFEGMTVAMNRFNGDATPKPTRTPPATDGNPSVPRS